MNLASHQMKINPSKPRKLLKKKISSLLIRKIEKHYVLSMIFQQIYQCLQVFLVDGISNFGIPT